jgi:hypothetical protein
MSTVRFATICDRCHRRSPEYDRWPVCRECQADICATCAEPDSINPADLGTPASALCATCAADLAVLA